MRIIAGKKRGAKLYTLEGNDITRPTLDRVKESLFNILLPRIENSIILDLFAGSGALGLEAASRGAKQVVLCDNSKKAIGIINKNIEKLNMESEIYVLNNSFENAIEICNNQKYKFDIVFLDPPYKTNYIEKATDLIIQKDLLAEDGIVVAETDQKDIILKQLENKQIEIFDTRKYGRVHILFFKRKG